MEIPTTGQDCLLWAEPGTQVKQSFQISANIVHAIPAEHGLPLTHQGISPVIDRSKVS